MNTLLAPIDTLINTYLPSFSAVLQNFSSFINTILGFFPWILSWFHIPTLLLEFVVGYYIAKLTISVAVHELKIILAWYRKLMP